MFSIDCQGLKLSCCHHLISVLIRSLLTSLKQEEQQLPFHPCCVLSMRFINLRKKHADFAILWSKVDFDKLFFTWCEIMFCQEERADHYPTKPVAGGNARVERHLRRFSAKAFHQSQQVASRLSFFCCSLRFCAFHKLGLQHYAMGRATASVRRLALKPRTDNGVLNHLWILPAAV